VPADIGFEAFKDVYMQAYESGCKGCTTYRPNDVTGSVLSVGEVRQPTDARSNSPAGRLKLARENAGFSSAAKAANRFGFCVTTYRSHENGTRNFTNSVEKYAEAFGVEAAWLFFGDTDTSVEAGQPPTAPTGGGFSPARGRGLPSESENRPEDLAAGFDGGEVIYMSEPLDRPSQLEGATYKLKWPDSNHAIYLTVNDIVLNGHRRPFEVFINSKNMEHFAWTVALTRMISAVFRRGGDVSFVVEELKAVFDPRGGAWMNGKYIPSILAAIGGILEQHMIKIGFLEGEGLGLKSDPTAQVVNLSDTHAPACPACGQFEMRMIEGCMTCASCGYSKCG